jgi:hypothetical protein
VIALRAREASGSDHVDGGDDSGDDDAGGRL